MAGLQAWDPTGRQILNMTMKISQTQGFVDTGGANGAIAIPGAPGGKTQFFIVVPLVDMQLDKGKRPGVTLSGGVLSWQYIFNTNGWGFFAANCRIFYGYF